ncbi:sensor domain-containing diguanylate cyclase [Vreelandella boliviensis]|uniref:Sensor domain-containing diguanylate cyclase n=1 Tax=Vreelandella boliviensis LC1 TaxID=1072583 RepID=A0A265DW60_9GAMM|nr:sensor domain-containing diguanylate cyclase [Halomonas boliviensis]EHJ92466.1 Signaling protein ykoW [Halomonas boliviensis LC1]OZT73557.1 sensor domain-containing diguanylate cyclase [Halomonas boliviensis LC1]
MIKPKLYIDDVPSELSHSQRLRHEKLRLLYSNLWQPVGTGILGAILLVFIMWDVVSSVLLLSWLVANVALSGVRLKIAHNFINASPAEQERSYWLRLFAFTVLLAGCVWGLAGLLMFDKETPEYAAALTIVLAGVSAGCVTMLSSIWWMVLFFILPIAIPLQLLFIFSDAPTHTMIGVLLGIFVLLLVATSYRLGRVIHNNIELNVAMTAREAQLLESENRYLSIFQHSPLGVLHFDKQGCVTNCNDKLLEILAIERSGLLGLSMQSDADTGIASATQNALNKGAGYYEGAFSSTCLSGRSEGTPVRAFFNGVRSVDDEIIGGVVIVEDFTERKRSEEVIYRQAYYDALTDLPNRRLLIERLATLCDQDSVQAQFGLLMFLDLDRFKLINDTWGHATGDDLLVQVASRLQTCLREGDLAARLSGDEFVLLALFEEDAEQAFEANAEAYMLRVQHALSQPYHLANHEVAVTPSIGYTCFTTTACEHEEVLKQADIAMYRAKTEGRARLRQFEPWMRDTMH